MNTKRTDKLSPGAGTGSRQFGPNRRNHADVLLALTLLVPLGAKCDSPDREYMNKLAEHLSQRVSGLTADLLTLSATPNCRAEQIELRSIQSNVFGTSTLTLRCPESRTLPFTASVAAKLARTQPTLSKAVALRAGSKIRLEMASQGVAMFTTGTALGSGGVGDVIRVRNTRTNRILRGRVIDPFTVRVGAQQ